MIKAERIPISFEISNKCPRDPYMKVRTLNGSEVIRVICDKPPENNPDCKKCPIFNPFYIQINKS